ncbi:4-hydroxy-2-oxoheptanedioate aldolase [Dongia mobilis]|uniref:4-hydroxy-2-oxoheptanedioate aldolase n=1 Tax=Dongia mobilis TaxID=578943 RepID=A0A4R6WVV4_9PROT|nr:aldolase/citrate lyase family protein [Dongia mobilis]TDQ81388.1 4-hydroxy-2-oxoheptanedioate aldolase [Dongia mobilis]
MPTGNPLKNKLRAGKTCIGSWLLTTSADMAEIMAYAGLDFLLIDHEHGQGAIDDAVGQMRAMKGTDCIGVLRVPTNDRIYIKRALDAGVAGIMVPNVDNAEQARAVVDACRYAPVGHRGAFGGMRAMRYGLNPGYYGEVDDDTLIVVQVENSRAIDNIPEIANVPGIDVIFIGPRDLSATLGKLNQFGDPVVRGEIERAQGAILASGKLLGSTAASGQVARDMSEAGYRFIISGSDATLLGTAASNLVAQARAGQGGDA